MLAGLLLLEAMVGSSHSRGCWHSLAPDHIAGLCLRGLISFPFTAVSSSVCLPLLRACVVVFRNHQDNLQMFRSTTWSHLQSPLCHIRWPLFSTPQLPVMLCHLKAWLLSVLWRKDNRWNPLNWWCYCSISPFLRSFKGNTVVLPVRSLVLLCFFLSLSSWTSWWRWPRT